MYHGYIFFFQFPSPYGAQCPRVGIAVHAAAKRPHEGGQCLEALSPGTRILMRLKWALSALMKSTVMTIIYM